MVERALTAFLVEDDPIVARALARSLTTLGYSIVGSVADASLAIDAIVAAKPDVLFLDIYLGAELNGIDIANGLQGRVDLPILFLTGAMDPPLSELVTPSGSFGYLAKPFGLDALRTSIELVRRQHAQPRGTARALVAAAPVRAPHASTQQGSTSETRFSCDDDNTIGVPDRDTRLREYHEQLELVVEATNVGLWEANLSEQIILCSERCMAMLGRAGEQTITQLADWEALVHPHDLESYRHARELHAAGRVNRYEHIHRMRHRDGRWLSILERGRVLTRDERGAVTRFCGTSVDITAESEAHREAVEASRAKTHFLANMSHELRTPLNAILGLSEALGDDAFGPLSTQQATAIRTIHDSGEHLLALINDVLDIARVESGKMPIEPEQAELHELVDESVALVRAQAKAKGVRLAVVVDGNLPALFVDRRRIKQVLINLLTNAIKFGPAGATVSLSASFLSDDGRVEVRISDDGPGIPAIDLERIFEPFVTLDRTLSRDQGGAGLGLTLVRRIVELHDGTIRVESDVQRGSTFVVTLPASSIATSPVDGSESSHERRPLAPLRHDPVVLLVEDNEWNVVMLQSYLEKRGCTVVVAHDGVSAVNEAADPRISIILMDVQLPVLNGLDAIRRIRGAERTFPRPIIALTANAMPEDRDRCLAAGATAYMAKPIRLQQLGRLIEQLLQEATARKP